MIDYQCPDTLAGVVAALTGQDDAHVLAGGTDLINEIRLGIVTPKRVVDLAAVGELAQVSATPNGVEVGATVTMKRIRQTGSPRLPAALHDAARLLGGRQMQTVATLGGNICHASPAAETATPMLVHDATARAVGPRGERSIDVAGFWAGPRRTTLDPDEVLVSFTIDAAAASWTSAYRRIELRHSVDIAIASASVAFDVVDGMVRTARVALGALGPVPFRVTEAEQAFAGLAVDRIACLDIEGSTAPSAKNPAGVAAAAAVDACARAVQPIDDVRGTARYRRAMAGVVLTRAAAAAAARAVHLQPA